MRNTAVRLLSFPSLAASNCHLQQLSHVRAASSVQHLCKLHYQPKLGCAALETHPRLQPRHPPAHDTKQILTAPTLHAASFSSSSSFHHAQTCSAFVCIQKVCIPPAEPAALRLRILGSGGVFQCSPSLFCCHALVQLGTRFTKGTSCC